MNPKEIIISNKSWWVKPIELLVHNWAVNQYPGKHLLNKGSM